MRIRLQIRQSETEAVRRELEAAGLIVCEDAPYELRETNAAVTFLSVRDRVGDRVQIPAGSVIFIESYGHNVDVHTTDGTYASPEPLHRLAAMLDPREFLRISSSVIIARRHVRKIRPSLSMKFVLTLSDGTLVDVPRSYYAAFRDFFNI